MKEPDVVSMELNSSHGYNIQPFILTDENALVNWIYFAMCLVLLFFILFGNVLVIMAYFRFSRLQVKLFEYSIDKVYIKHGISNINGFL